MKPTRLTRGLVLLAAGGVLALDAPASRAQQTSRFQARADLVSVAVSVMRGREPATGLTAADFVLTERRAADTRGHLS